MADQKELAYQDYLKGMKYKDIAEKYGVTINTVKSWKTRYKWSRDGVHTKEKSVHTKKRGGQPGNQNAKGHGAPKNNQNATKHGFFSKYIPQETLEIMGMLEEKSPADLIWDQIQIQYAAIIRAQQIMFVEAKDEMIKELKKEKTELESSKDKDGNIESIPTYVEREYEFQFAWDRHATFLNAQSRAMSELRSLIRQFEEMASMNDERRLKLEQMKFGIEKTKKETEFIEERTKQLKGAAKDTSKLDALIKVVTSDD
ncbi:yqaS, phage-related terminase small subunit [Bacillus methanolicus PB1]|uniref:YqaS, phage-related terminase small subunit n=1 Tax=Bacillus methanolicus PB1 TaxID=997296 RepID=I3DY05_BACMT|nr:phage terminase small subunit [Bacillus methanolicus]EIJ79126.1 yqaS, phage-related terminase small subunit [Bacillus methanolicus PB1]